MTGALDGVHLIAAGEVVGQGYPASTRLPVRGESVTSAADGGEADPGYRGDRVSAAIQRSQGMDDSCPHRGGTSDVTVPTGTSPEVRAWSCSACGTEWAVTVVNPRSYLDYLVATAELAGARLALRALLTLADDAPTLTDAELRTRLTALAGRFPPVVKSR